MKTKNALISALIFAWSIMLITPGYAAQVSDVAQDHKAMSVSYQQKAAAQDAIIGEHQQMKQDYKKRFYINDKVTPKSKIKKMEKHCDALIKDAQKLKTDYLDFAKWHQMRAAELQGS